MASEGWGGAEKVVVELAAELSKEHEVTVLVLRGTEWVSRLSSRVRVVQLRANPTRYNPFLSLEIYSVLKRLRPDIIHTHAVKGTELVAAVNRFLHMAHLGTKHNVRKGKIFNRLRWVSVVSAASKATISPVQGGVVKVIHNGILPEAVGEVGKNKIFTLLAVGRLDRLKGFHDLIDQVRQLPFEVQLRIVGEGPERDTLQQQVQQAGMEGTVVLTGHREDIPRLMARAHVVVISSLSEGFSRVAIEALQYGDLLISTPVGICTEILPPRLLAERQQLAEVLGRVYGQYSQYRECFAALKKERADAFLLPAIVQQYVGYYQKIKEDGEVF